MCDCDGDDCCRRVVKFLLVVVNLFFFLLGLLMLAFGIAMVVAPDQVAVAVEDTGANLTVLGNAQWAIKGSGIFMIVLGGIVTLIGAFGFFGACCESKVLLVLYLVLVILILLAEVALIIFAACFPTAFNAAIQGEMYKTMISSFSQDIQLYPNTTIGYNSANGYGWAMTQADAKCCGVLGPSDYNTTRYDSNHRQVYVNSNATAVSLPLSCCVLKTQLTSNTKADDFADLNGCINNATNPGSAPPYYTDGCFNRIESMVQQASNIAIGIAAAIVGFQIIIIVLGFILCCSLHNSKSHTV